MKHVQYDTVFCPLRLRKAASKSWKRGFVKSGNVVKVLWFVHTIYRPTKCSVHGSVVPQTKTDTKLEEERQKEKNKCVRTQQIVENGCFYRIAASY